ncbi:helix-turn-helix domain-containing protein [Kribbella solani]|uniref:helix-turn-helix domain-containing protein n=1 Tax=Kribbella solani TaxID=236067 RepID=UPI0029B0EB13|nr:helix-turn-helix domain-containing protein [Kribbella solani]MDX2970529.1 helix-turn-helix domain-containing protein [Kribbella solani]
MHTVRDVGATVREARVRRRLTQAVLAARAGVSREWLVRLEQGHPRLEMQLVLDTFAALDLTLTAAESEPADPSYEARWDTVFGGLTERPPEDD